MTKTTWTTTVPATDVQEGDFLVFRSGRRTTKPVSEVDRTSNVHGLVIIRYGNSSMVRPPMDLMTVTR